MGVGFWAWVSVCACPSPQETGAGETMLEPLFQTKLFLRVGSSKENYRLMSLWFNSLSV